MSEAPSMTINFVKLKQLHELHIQVEDLVNR